VKAITVEPKKPKQHDTKIFRSRIHVRLNPRTGSGRRSVWTDVEIVEGKYGWAPPGKTRLVLGHESLGRVMDPGPSSS